MISHCSFNLHFALIIDAAEYLHVFICHSYIFCGAQLLPIFKTELFVLVLIRKSSLYILEASA